MGVAVSESAMGRMVMLIVMLMGRVFSRMAVIMMCGFVVKLVFVRMKMIMMLMVGAMRMVRMVMPAMRVPVMAKRHKAYEIYCQAHGADGEKLP